MKRLAKIAGLLASLFFLVLVAGYVALQQPSVQTWLAQKVAAYLSDKWDTKVAVKGVNIKFVESFVLEDIYIEDQRQDTLLYTKELGVELDALSLLNKDIDISRINLSNGKLNISRDKHQQHFNHHFLTKSLQSSKEDAKGSGEPWQFDLTSLSLDGIAFTLNDEREGNKIEANVRDLALAIDQFYLAGQKMDIQSLTVEGLFFHYIKMQDTTAYKTKQVAANEEVVMPVDTPVGQDSFLPGWQINTQDVRIANATFRFDNRTEPPMQDAGIDYDHLHVSNINIALNDLSYSNDTLQTQISKLNLIEESGFRIRNLSSDFTISDKGFTCRNLTLQTPNSHIRNYFSMSYNAFADFKDFNQRVEMRGKFRKSKVALQDINYFAHELDKIAHNTVRLTGDIYGRVNHLRGDDLTMKLGENSVFDGDFSLRGLPDVEETFITFRLNRLATEATDIKRVYPDVSLPPEVHRMGRLVFSGAFDGFYNDFVAEGTLHSDIGQINSDLNLKIDENTQLARYKGKLAAKKLDLGAMFNERKMIGEVTFQSNLKGRGMGLERLEADLDTDIERLVFNGYHYRDIEMDGHVKQKLFTGHLTVDDQNLGLNFIGTVNFNKTQPEFKAEANIDSANLKALNVSNEEYLVQSNMQLDFRGQSIDDLLGNIELYDTRIDKNKKSYKLDSFQLKAHRTDGQKEIKLRSGLADAHFRGTFNYEQMLPALHDYFNHYFNTNLRDLHDSRQLVSQKFEYRIHLKKTDDFANVFLPEWRLPKGSTIKGSFDREGYDLLLNATIPLFQYQNTTLKDIQIKSTSNQDELNLSTNIGQMTSQDHLISQNISLSSNAAEDSVQFSVNAKGESSDDRINLNGFFSTQHDSFIVAKIEPSTIFLNDKKWRISKNNYIRYSPGQLVVSDFVLQQEQRKINVESFVNGDGESVVGIGLENIQIRDITKPFIPNPYYEVSGIANGNLRIADIFQDPLLISSLRVKDAAFREDTIGDVKLVSNYNNTANSLYLDLDVSGAQHKLRAIGTYDLGEQQDTASIDVDISRIHLPVIEKYVEEEVTDIKGWAQGNLHLAGSFEKPELLGTLTLHNTEFTVNYLNTHYLIDDQQIRFTKRWLDFQQMTVRDVKGNTATLGGQIFHSHLRDFSIDAYLQTDRFQFLNTTRHHNKDYFGTAYGDGSVVFQGPFDNIEVFVSAETKKNTTLSIPVSGSNDLGNNDFYRFVNTSENEDGDTTQAEFQTNTTNFNLNFDLSVTPDALMRIIFDLKAGDVIEARGRGNIEMLINNFGDFEMVGTYEIQEGDYLFTFQDIVNKKFVIESGGKIIWTGNPHKARIDLNAIYETRTAPYPLIADLVRKDEQQLATAKERVPVDLYLQLGGSLLSPNINFDIRMPEAPPTLRNPIESQLRAIKQNDHQLNRQVFGLLVLNNFISDPNQTSSVAAQTNPYLASGVNNTVSEFLSNQVSIYFSDWFSRFVTDMNFDFSYRNYEVGNQQNSNSNSQDPDELYKKGQEVELEMSKKFFNDRVSVNVGGNVDIDNTSTASKDQGKVSNITSDFIIEYDIKEDGNVKVKAFSKREYDMFSDERENKNGLGLFYREEFDTFGELIRNILGSKESEEEDKQPPENLP